LFQRRDIRRVGAFPSGNLQTVSNEQDGGASNFTMVMMKKPAGGVFVAGLVRRKSFSKQNPDDDDPNKSEDDHPFKIGRLIRTALH